MHSIALQARLHYTPLRAMKKKRIIKGKGLAPWDSRVLGLDASLSKYRIDRISAARGAGKLVWCWTNTSANAAFQNTNTITYICIKMQIQMYEEIQRMQICEFDSKYRRRRRSKKAGAVRRRRRGVAQHIFSKPFYLYFCNGVCLYLCCTTSTDLYF